MFPLLFVFFLLLLLVTDYVFLPRGARRAWLAMVAVFAVAASMVFFTPAWQAVAAWVGIGRPVDILIYIATAALVREMLVVRARAAEQDKRITELVRQLAVTTARRI
jgi:hypothetical protein